MKILPFALITGIFLTVISSLNSCSTAYYGAMEKVGLQKRDILVSRVKKAKASQIETKEEFQSALDEFLVVADTPASKLESQYRKVQKAYDRAEKQAADVKARHDDVEKVSKHLFSEWDKEIKEFQNPEFAAQSRRQRVQSEDQAEDLIAAMRRAERRIDPVLREFRDHVLFLKHNLNTRAIASLEGQVSRTKVDVSRLIKEMNLAIAEADTFINQMNQQ